MRYLEIFDVFWALLSGVCKCCKYCKYCKYWVHFASIVSVGYICVHLLHCQLSSAQHSCIPQNFLSSILQLESMNALYCTTLQGPNNRLLKGQIVLNSLNLFQFKYKLQIVFNAFNLFQFKYTLHGQVMLTDAISLKHFRWPSITNDVTILILWNPEIEGLHISTQ